ncbi:MAG: trypsin-like serine protease [Clostridia bacterium]|nr:trypsin-like serine protease [Clostridia bacterium]
MKKLLSIGLSIVLTLSFGYTVSAQQSAMVPSVDDVYNSTLYRYDVSEKTVASFTVKSFLERNNYNFQKSSEESYLPYYTPEGLTESHLPAISQRHLLGSWTAINPATSAPYRTTVYIQCELNGTLLRGTGFMIGPCAVATAAHVIFDIDTDEFVENAVVFPARTNNSTPYGSANASAYMIPTGYSDSGNSNNYDWGIIELESNIGDTVGYMGIATKTSSYNGTSISLTGYPATVSGNTTRVMYRSDGTISNSATYTLSSTNTNTSGGMSGGPVYYNKSGAGYTAIGIISGGNNSGTQNKFARITREVFDLFGTYRDIRV